VLSYCLYRQSPTMTSGKKHAQCNLHTCQCRCLTLRTPLKDRQTDRRTQDRSCNHAFTARENTLVHPEPSSTPSGKDTDNETFVFLTSVQAVVSGQPYQSCGTSVQHILVKKFTMIGHFFLRSSVSQSSRSRQSTNTSSILGPCEQLQAVCRVYTRSPSSH
jgi:hypothetical protein